MGAARSGDDGRRKGLGDEIETSAPCACSRCSSPSRVRRRLEEEQEGVGGGMGRQRDREGRGRDGIRSESAGGVGDSHEGPLKNRGGNPT
jgi:hypothetical protein